MGLHNSTYDSTCEIRLSGGKIHSKGLGYLRVLDRLPVGGVNFLTSGVFFSVTQKKWRKIVQMRFFEK